jgi:hypothetical protein
MILMALGIPLLGTVECFQLGLFVDEDDLIILDILASIDVEDFLE